MKLIEQINDDLKVAMRAKDELVLSTLRLLKSAARNREIELGHILSDEELAEVVAKAVKQRRDSIIEYEKGNRAELASKEKAEIKILEKYLPAQLSQEEISKTIDEVIKSTGAQSLQDFGKVMSAVMPKLKGQADGTIVASLTKDKLK